MGKAVQGAVIALNFLFTVSLCYIYVSDNWVQNEKKGQTIETVTHQEGFWWRCVDYGDGKQKACDDFDEWIFSPTFPSWILAGRVMLFLAIAIGFASTLGFMMGSRMTTMYENSPGSKLMLRRASSVMVFLAGAFCITTALWVFIMTAKQYGDFHSVYYGQGQGLHNGMKFIPGAACYGSIIMGSLWLGLGVMACFCTGDAMGKEHASTAGWNTNAY